jgi:hypothetical protein
VSLYYYAVSVGTCIVAVQPGYLRCCGNDASGRRLASDGSHNFHAFDRAVTVIGLTLSKGKYFEFLSDISF